MFSYLFKIFNIFLISIFDYFDIVNSRKIAFVIKKNSPFSGNTRAVADALVKQGARNLVIYKEGALDEECLSWRQWGIRVYTKFSLSALRDVHTAGVIFLGHSGRDAFLRRRKKGRKVINLWHGVAIKKIEHLMPAEKRWTYKAWKRRRLMRVNSRVYDRLVASSATDRLTNALAFGLNLDKVYAIGLPRFDYLAPDYVFSSNLRQDLNRLDVLLAGRRMVLYAPTFREVGASALTGLTPEVLDGLKAFLRQHNLVLGIRPHPYDQRALAQICDGQWVLDVSPDVYIEPAIVLRAASALIVDYSSIWVDYLLLKRPIIGLMPDFDDYATQERGFIFDLAAILPGPIFQDWSAVMAGVSELSVGDFSVSSRYAEKFTMAENLFLPTEELRFKGVQSCLSFVFPDDRSIN